MALKGDIIDASPNSWNLKPCELMSTAFSRWTDHIVQAGDKRRLDTRSKACVDGLWSQMALRDFWLYLRRYENSRHLICADVKMIRELDHVSSGKTIALR